MHQICYLLIGVHASKATLVTRFAALLCDLRDFLLGTVGEVARVGIAG